MTTFGLTDSGFQIKRLQDSLDEIEAALRDGLGNGINLLPTGLLGQIAGIISEMDAKNQETLQNIYESQSPSTASGVSLDNITDITLTKRLEATKGTGSGIAYGDLGTVITAGSIISVSGNSSAKFVTLNDETLAAGTDEVQDIDFSAVPDAGAWTLTFDGQETTSLAYNDNATAIQSALNGLSNLSGVTVSGNYTSGFTVTFSGSDGQQDQLLLQSGTNTLTHTSTQVNLTFAETTKGVLPNVSIDVEAQDAGLINAYADTLTVIETPISGWLSFNNDADIAPGKEVETDAELRLRRRQTLALPGSATTAAIRSKILTLDEVNFCKVFENATSSVDGSGRPAHSIAAVVDGGDNQDIFDAILSSKAGGIETYGSTSGTSTDSQGIDHTIKFSRPTPIDIYLTLTLTKDSTFPSGGDDTIKDNIVAFALENFQIGDDVITSRLYCPINDVQGVTGITIDIGTAPSPSGSANISIADTEVANFDTANIDIVTV